MLGAGDSLFGVANRGRCRARELARGLPRPLDERFVIDDNVDETKGQGFLGVDETASEDEIAGDGGAAQSRQKINSAPIRVQSDAGEARTEARRC